MGILAELARRNALRSGSLGSTGGVWTIGDILGSTEWIKWGRSTIRHDAGVSVGSGDIPTVERSGAWIPELAPVPTTKYNLPIPPPLDRRDIPQVQAPIMLTPQQQNDKAWAESLGLEYVLPPPVQDWVYNPQPVSIFPTEGEDDVGWISDVYDIVDTSLGGILPGGVPFGSSGPQTLYNYVDGSGQPPIQPPVTIQGNSCDPNDPSRGMVYKKVCGQYKWVKVKRRRRKALATKSDLAGLASLKGILGTGKAFEVWIATHS